MLSLSNHSKGNFLECRRKYQLAGAWELRQTSGPRAIGTITHYALSLWDTGKGDDECLSMMLEFIKELKMDEDEQENVIEVTFNLVSHYFDHYRNNRLNFLASETVFAAQLSPNLTYRGRIDGLLNYNGKVAIGERKTSSLAPGQFFKQYQAFDDQSIGYCDRASQIFGMEVEGFVVDAIFKVTGKRHEPEFRREYFSVDARKRDIWKLQTLQIADDIEKAVATDTMYPNFNACIGKYGPCDFYDHCHEPNGDQNLAVLESSHRRRRAHGTKQSDD